MNKTHFSVIALALSFLLIPFCLLAQEVEENAWPQEIQAKDYLVVIYQPQPERLDGDRLYGRAAVAVEAADKSEPVFGAIWFDARLVTDLDERTAVFADIKITRVRFPNEDKGKGEKLAALLETELTGNRLPINLDNLAATLETIEQREQAAENLNVTPPQILFVTEPAVLISIDGEPQIRDEEGISRVINTPLLLFRTRIPGFGI
ncbi:MAG: hypothetical protein GY875_12945 [Gammaproteobacteria bacterium]|nr:hypothetical protein [Gammaproteobacteria bacterium]